MKELLPGLNALFGMTHQTTEPFSLTLRQYRTKGGNIMFEVRCNWFGSSRHRKKELAVRRCQRILKKLEEGSGFEYVERHDDL